MISYLKIHRDAESRENRFQLFLQSLKSGGIFALLLNSTNDPECGEGIKIEEDLYEVDGIQKRYFSLDSIRRYAKDFQEIAADNNGETYKDRAKGTERLIRFIGRK